MRSMLVVLAALAVGGCYDDDDYDPGVPTELELVAGDDQFATVGQQVPEPLTARVINLEGDPVEGVTVEWFVMNGGGSVSASRTTSDEAGLVQVTFTLGSFVGAQEVQAVNNNLVNSPLVYSAIGQPSGGGGPPPESRGK